MLTAAPVVVPSVDISPSAAVIPNFAAKSFTIPLNFDDKVPGTSVITAASAIAPSATSAPSAIDDAPPPPPEAEDPLKEITAPETLIVPLV